VADNLGTEIQVSVADYQTRRLTRAFAQFDLVPIEDAAGQQFLLPSVSATLAGRRTSWWRWGTKALTVVTDEVALSCPVSYLLIDERRATASAEQ